MSKAADAMHQPTGPCIEPFSDSDPSEGNGDAGDATPRAFAAVRGWCPPPNWSLRDWHKEARAIIAAAGCRADFDYDPKRGVPRAAFAYKRAVASVWTRYRQEWAYARRFAAAPPKTVEQPVSAPCDPNDSVGAMVRLLGEALNQLPSPDRWLIQELFWKRKTEDQLSATLRISQQAVSRRKGRALKRLRRVCNLALVSQFLSVVAAFLDSLDLLPTADFWL
jgi:DNA-directed RNA polymerase specialized sigma24 family protein